MSCRRDQASLRAMRDASSELLKIRQCLSSKLSKIRQCLSSELSKIRQCLSSELLKITRRQCLSSELLKIRQCLSSELSKIQLVRNLKPSSCCFTSAHVLPFSPLLSFHHDLECYHTQALLSFHPPLTRRRSCVQVLVDGLPFVHLLY